jgi:hypothetical protein
LEWGPTVRASAAMAQEEKKEEREEKERDGCQPADACRAAVLGPGSWRFRRELERIHGKNTTIAEPHLVSI